MRHIVRAEGAWLTAADGERILDGICSWWVITHGHCHPHIVEAIRRQAGTLDQIIFAEFTHDSAERLAAGLIRIAPRGLEHVFLSDSGSTSVEVALKMALGYWRHRGEPRSRIIVMEHGYHGDTIGAMSVGARGPFNEAYEPMLFQVERIPFPAPGREAATLEALTQLCLTGEAAALLLEPLVLGAGGMHMYSPAVLAQLHAICGKHGVIFIADEVMTGWGRTGTRFACDQAALTPDILCLSKGLTGGALPLAATLCRPALFEAHYSADRRRTFFHSSSFTGNPIACAAALANLEIWEREPVLERIAVLAERQQQQLERLRGDRRFDGLRRCGTIVALDLRVADAGYLAQVGPLLRASFRDSGVLLRPLGNTIYVMPPYCIGEQELGELYRAILCAADALGGDRRPRGQPPGPAGGRAGA
jgi:adenosylmethionine-8-amino-7-oxononanoate aminotransferase